VIVWAMHNIGIRGMQVDGSWSVETGMSLASLAVGTSLGALSLLVVGRRAGIARRSAGAALLAISVCGLHLTGMAGIEIAPGLGGATSGHAVMGSTTMAVAVAAVATVIAVIGLLLAVFDQKLSARSAAEAERIYHMAHHDALTGLANRVKFNAQLTKAVEGQRGGRVAVLCLDLDRFKSVNDLLGHQGGDDLLVQVTRRLCSCVRPSDVMARLGGDEFAVLQQSPNQPEAAEILAHRLVEALSQPFEIDGQSVSVGTSVGIALYPSDGDSAGTLLRNADTALYGAKNAGRGTHRFFEAAMEERLRERRLLERDLREALARGTQLLLHYQPIVDCDGSRTVGFEALLRWDHPTRGQIRPDVLIPIAEESGLILLLGRWVLETACAEAVTWNEPWRVAVNLSPTQFRQPGLAQVVSDVLRDLGLPPDRLELEVTEGVLIEDTSTALVTFTDLKEIGVRLSLDDFGTGYSSLGYLRQFPFDKIKIDRSFVQGLGKEGEADAIVDAILGLARGMKLEVTAEGVETEDQLGRLRDKRCLQAQGYLLGRPSAVVKPYTPDGLLQSAA
jgi:diguanylate cyclase (GGDEF)-like protein